LIAPIAPEGARTLRAEEEEEMFGGGEKIKIKKELYERAEKFSELAGYSSMDEFVEYLLEKEISKLEGADSEEEIKKKLKGLGYIS